MGKALATKPQKEVSKDEIRDYLLSPMQTKFVHALVHDRLSRLDAGRAAGYSEKNLSQCIWNTLNLPHVRQAIQRERELYLSGEVATKAAHEMENLLLGAESETVRFQTAKFLLENAGHGLEAKKALASLITNDKPLSEMTVDELASLLDKTRKSIESVKVIKEKTVELSPVSVEESD